MLSDVIRFEWRYHLRQPAFIAASLFFFLFGFALTATRFGPDNVDVTSPFLVMESFAFISLFSLFAVAIFAANAVLRDDEHRMREIVFSTPVGRFAYLFGRFGGAFLTTLTAVATSVLGMLAGTLLPMFDPERVGAVDARTYLWAFAVIAIPNVLFATALLFAVAVLTRNSIATYAAAVVVYALYLVCSALTESPLMAASKPGGGGGLLPSLLDPFGLTSFFDVTRYWTAAAKNRRFVPLSGTMLFNRMLWVGATLAICAWTYRRFSFRVERRLPVRRRTGGHDAGAATPRWTSPLLSATRMELRVLVTKTSLLLFLLWIAVVITELYSGVLDAEYRSTLYPATGLILAALQQPMMLMGVILIIYYGSEIFWREQRFGMSPIIDTTPVSGSVMIASKGLALATLIGVLILGAMAAGVGVQISRGYSNFEPLLYLSFFYFAGVPLLLFAAASLFIHSLSPGKYAGMVLVLLFVVFTRRASSIGLEHDLWRFASAPGLTYTDFHGFRAEAFHWFMLHWALIALLFAAIAAMLWRRIEFPVRERIRSLRPRKILLLVVAPLLTGGWIIANTDFESSNELFTWKADYEKSYKRYEKQPRPRIDAVDAEVDFYPREERYRVAGRYGLVNETAAPIGGVWIALRREAKVAALSMPNARLTSKDARFGMYRFDFDKPLAPGARGELRFDLRFEPRGFENDDVIVENGSFLMGYLRFPSLGYRRTYEISDPRERRKRGLSGAGVPELQENGTHGGVDTSDEDWIAFRATVSTSADQIAVAPGRLEKTWERDGRRWFRYRSETPIRNRLGFLSARYTVAKRKHHGVDIEVYHHPSHGVNAPRILDTMAATLDVMRTRFEPYPHRQLRLTEIPAYFPYAGFALSEIILMREDRGFATDTRDPNRPDIVGRRVAHEVAHQWFGYRVVPATVEGASLIVESLTKYSELLAIEKLHGREHVRQLLEIELDRYLTGRAGERNVEVPLYKVDNQAYLFYSKGAIVLYAIRDLIGADAMDGAIRELMKERRPTSIDLARNLRAAAGEKHAALIDQWLKEIVLYDFRADAATARRRPDGRYDVTLRVNAVKSRADGSGNETPIPFQEEIEIAVDDHSRKYPLHQGLNEITLIVDKPPVSMSVDPWITRIDRTPLDNGKEF